MEEVRNALDEGHTLTDCANALGMHRTTLWRQLKEDNPEYRAYPTMTVDEVCVLITQNVAIFGYAKDWGIRFVQAKLKRLGHKVSRTLVRDALDRLLPGVLEERMRRCISRRIYDVTEPMHVWHMDSYDKLARWGFRVHGAIDGASHYVVYMKVALNKRAPTIFAAYKGAIEKFGHPWLIRSDYAAEHSLVRRNLERARPNVNCFRTGSSVHNQRIEAFWGHIRKKACQYFKDDLHSLSYEEGLLKIEDSLHRSCMVTVFLPLIEQAVSDAILTWNTHTVRNVKHGGMERASHIPAMLFQAREREAGLVFPPPYTEGADLDSNEEDADADGFGRDTWNHNNDMGNFEGGIRDLQDPDLRNLRDGAYNATTMVVPSPKDKLRMHLMLSLECRACSEAAMGLEDYITRELLSPNLSYYRTWSLQALRHFSGPRARL